MPEDRLRYLWCDGFLPGQYLLDGNRPRITGTAWICNGLKQDEWRFTLFLPRRVAAPHEIEWASLLPPQDVTRWLAVDQQAKCIQIEPSAACAISLEV
jgi:hypothetical protein